MRESTELPYAQATPFSLNTGQSVFHRLQFPFIFTFYYAFSSTFLPRIFSRAKVIF